MLREPRSRRTGSSPATGGSRPSPCSPRASTCASATTRGRCGAASCPTATRRSRRRSQDLAFERIDLRDGVTLERDRPYLVPLIEGLRAAAGHPREGQPEELDRAPGRLHARADRPQPPLRRDRRRIQRRALPGGRAAHVRHPRQDGPRAQPGAPDVGRRTPERRGAGRAARPLPRCSTATGSRWRRASSPSATACS